MLTSSPAPPEIIDVLDRGERVLWSDRPRQGLVLRALDAFIIPFSVVWAGGAATAAWASVHRTDPIGMLVGALFAVVGFYLVMGRFFVDVAQRRRTFYAVTNERVLIVSGLLSRDTQSLSLRTLDQVNVSSRASGRGTIMFGRNPYGSFTLPGWPGSGKYLPPMFDMIPDAADVAKLIRDAQRSAIASAERA